MSNWTLDSRLIAANIACKQNNFVCNSKKTELLNEQDHVWVTQCDHPKWQLAIDGFLGYWLRQLLGLTAVHFLGDRRLLANAYQQTALQCKVNVEMHHRNSESECEGLNADKPIQKVKLFQNDRLFLLFDA